MNSTPYSAAFQTDESVGSVLRALLTRPYEVLVVRWNWKAALLSAAARAPIFLVATLGHGWRRASIAMVVEALFRAASTGLLAAGVQAFRRAKPRWMAVLLILTGFPLLAQALDALVHMAVGTPNLSAAIMVSLIVSAVASVFDWYAMRRGALLMGEEAGSLWSDLKALPSLVLGFILVPGVWVWRLTLQRLTRERLARSEAE